MILRLKKGLYVELFVKSFFSNDIWCHVYLEKGTFKYGCIVYDKVT